MAASEDIAHTDAGLLPPSVRLLGDLSVMRNGQPVPLPASRRTRALLGYLIATGAPQSRQALCDLLWEGPDDPRAALRWSLTKLRPVLDDAAAVRLEADRERVAFAAHGAPVDIVQLMSLIAGGAQTASLASLEAAAALLHGEFLAGLDLANCYRFYHWCAAERERYDAVRHDVLTTLIARLQDDPARALPHGRALVAAEPLAESAHATLVTLLAAADRYPDAEQHYAYARDLLRRELSAADHGPLDDAIHRARRAVQAASHRAGPAPAPASAPPAGEPAEAPGLPHLSRPQPMPTSIPLSTPASTPTAASQQPSPSPSPSLPPLPPLPPLTGREAERAAIAQLAAGDCSPGLTMFVGEPGLGKTRLLDHLASLAHAAGRRVLRGRCYEAEMVRPYGLWLDAWRSVGNVDGGGVGGVGGGEAAGGATLAMTPFGAATSGDEAIDHEAGRARLFQSVADALLALALAARQPVVLTLDDLQWIDEGSAALLHYLVRTLQGDPRVVLAGAARPGEIDDNRCATRMLHALARVGFMMRFDLAPLSAGEISALLASAGATLDAQAVARESGGNPLFALEIAHAAGQGGQEGQGSQGGRTLDALVADRLDALDAPARELLVWAAAVGRALAPEWLAGLANIAEAQALATLDRLTRRGLLRTGADGLVDFSHDVVRQAAYRSLSPPRRRMMHRLIARQMIAASADDPRLHGEVVHHASLADDAAMTAQACADAAEQCLRVYANGEAAAVADRGLATLPRLPAGAARVRLEIRLLRLRVMAAAGCGASRLPALADAIERAIADADALALHDAAASGLHILSWLRQQGNDVESVRRATLAAERMSRKADAATRCQQLANTARCLLEVESDLPRARAMLGDADALAQTLDLQVIELLWGQGLLARVDGGAEPAHAQVARACALAQARGDHWREYECRVWLATLSFELGRDEAVIALAAEIGDVARRMGESGAPFADALGALSAIRRTHAAEDPLSDSALATALGALHASDDKAHLAYALNAAAQLAMARGQWDVAAACAHDALAAARVVRRLTESVIATACLAQSAAANGDRDAHAQWLAELRWLIAGQRPGARAVAALERALMSSLPARASKGEG